MKPRKVPAGKFRRSPKLDLTADPDIEIRARINAESGNWIAVSKHLPGIILRDESFERLQATVRATIHHFYRPMSAPFFKRNGRVEMQYDPQKPPYRFSVSLRRPSGGRAKKVTPYESTGRRVDARHLNFFENTDFAQLVFVCLHRQPKAAIHAKTLV